MSDQRTLPQELTIYTISETYPMCLSWLDAHAHSIEDDPCLQVAAHAVMEVDAAGVQLLMSLSNSLLARQRQLQLLNPSENLSAACLALGAGGLLAQANAMGGTH